MSDPRHIQLSPGDTPESKLSELGITAFHIIRSTECRRHGGNVGALHHYWCLVMISGLWYPVRVWDVEIGERWILVDTHLDIATECPKKAELEFHLRFARLEVLASQDCVERYPDEPGHKEMLASAQSRLNALLQIEQGQN
jgi:hypothetical protein